MVLLNIFYQLFNIKPTKIIKEDIYVRLVMLARKYGVVAVRAESNYHDLLEAICGQLISILTSLKETDRERFKWLVAKQFTRGKNHEINN